MIRITREKKYIGCLIAYKIYIDGGYRGEIWWGETKEFPVENGRHSVYATAVDSGPAVMSWGRKDRSNTLRVVVSDSCIVDLEVGDALTGWKRWLFPFSNIFIEKDEHLFVREKKAADESVDCES